MRVDKRAAAAIQIDAAIGHYAEANYVCAITLAGAAEGCMPPTEDWHLFPGLKKLACKYLTSIPENKAVQLLNADLYWLKHHNEGQPLEINVEHAAAFQLIARATTKFLAIHGQAHETERMNWFWNAFEEEIVNDIDVSGNAAG